MTYFGFLARFLIPPILILAMLTWRDHRRGRRLPDGLDAWPAWIVVIVHVVVAVIYTTPWDNYLVATRVWWYEPALVSGLILGWVPVEEYLFFVLQTVLASLWLLWLARRMMTPEAHAPDAHGSEAMARRVRWIGSTAVACLWLAGLWILIARWGPGTYLGLELTWALTPIFLQMAFGGDILWRHRRLVLSALIPVWLYLCAADFAAIGLGTWIIAPEKSTGIGVGHLPLEEVVFFLLTNMLVVFGTVLVLARESQTRVPARLRGMLPQQTRTDRSVTKGSDSRA